MRTFVFSFIVAVVLSGCGGSKPATYTSQIVKDSIWTAVKRVQRDTIITIPGDTTYITVPVMELTEVPVTKTNGRSTASIKRVGDDIQVSCECAEYKQKIALLETIISQYEKIQELTDKTVVVPERYIPWWVKILAWIGAIALAASGVLVTFKFIRPL